MASWRKRLPPRKDTNEASEEIEIVQLCPREWIEYAEFRLAALSSDPSSFSSSVEQESQYDESVWKERIRWMYFARSVAHPQRELLACLGVMPEALLEGCSDPNPAIGCIVSVWTHPKARRLGVMETLLREVIRYHNSPQCVAHHRWDLVPFLKGEMNSPAASSESPVELTVQPSAPSCAVRWFALETNSCNVAATKLYLKLGFRPAPRRISSCPCDSTFALPLNADDSLEGF